MSVLNVRLFDLVHMYRYGFDVVCIGHEFMCLGVVGMSEVYMLKSVGERTPLCGTSVDVVFLKVV